MILVFVGLTQKEYNYVDPYIYTIVESGLHE